MVYFVGNAARFVTTTNVSDTIAAMINPKDAPLKRIAAIVKGNNTAAITVIEMPTQETWLILS